MADPGFGNGGSASLKRMDLYADSPGANSLMVASASARRDCILGRYRDMPPSKFRKSGCCRCIQLAPEDLLEKYLFNIGY